MNGRMEGQDTQAAAIASVLRAAADIAERQPNLKRAIQAGWSACHIRHDLIDEVFTAWQQSEDVAYHASRLGGILARRYKTPADIAASLRKAASAQAR